MIKKGALLLVAIVIAVTVFFVMRLQRPAQGVISRSFVAEKNIQATASDKTRTDGKYLSFAASSQYVSAGGLERDSSSNTPLEGGSLLQSSLLVSYTAAASKKLAVSVERLEGAGFSGNASYMFRVSSPKLYTENSKDIAGERAAFFVRNEGMMERTVFLRHDGLVATVSLSALGGDSNALEDEVLEAAKSIRWKE